MDRLGILARMAVLWASILFVALMELDRHSKASMAVVVAVAVAVERTDYRFAQMALV